MNPDITSSPSDTSKWAAAVTAVAGAVALLLKKRLTRTRNPPPVAPKGDFITRTEFHASLDTLRDRLDTNHKELLSALVTQGTIIEKRLDSLETSVARLDERTKSP
jgi:hypothetical protein